MSNETDNQATVETDSGSLKTAVILVHGIGEQWPMDTLWSFLDAAWINDRDVVEPYHNIVYSKPSFASDNMELRRITTRSSKDEAKKKFVFYEYYWAHMMVGNKMSDISRWIVSLIWRDPKSIPSSYLKYLFAAWAIGLLSALVVICSILWSDIPDWWALIPAILTPLWSRFLSEIFVPYAGDAARYLRAIPDNVAARQRIRSGGVDLLTKLTNSGKYDRIIMVGHSLGSVIAYDILTHAWAQLGQKALQDAHGADPLLAEALKELEAAGVHLLDAHDVTSLDAFRQAQRKYQDRLSKAGEPLWLVTDLVTLGSPLGKADILMARDVERFEKRKERREFPTCPPLYEYWSRDNKKFSYSYKGAPYIPHHAAPFAATRWTNLYFPTSHLVFGDPVSGPVAHLFGAGAKDVELPLEPYRFQHLDYWRQPDPDKVSLAVSELRKALDLLDRDRPTGAHNSGG